MTHKNSKLSRRHGFDRYPILPFQFIIGATTADRYANFSNIFLKSLKDRRPSL